jgi:hypothetical protein
MQGSVVMAIAANVPPESVPRPVPDRSERPVRDALVHEGKWVLAAAGLGFTISATCSQVLHLPRPWVILVLTIGVALLTAAFVRSHDLDVKGIIQHRWLWAVARGIVMGGVLILLVLPHDPSPRAEETQLIVDVVWLGVVYGAAEALLVNVVPMMAAWRAFKDAGWTASWSGKISAAAFTMASNLLVTSAYNLGFPEFRGAEISGPIAGNLLIAAGFVLAPNPIISIVSHIILHVASVLAGAEGPVHLPPHY